MSTFPKLLPQKVVQEKQADGTLLLRSGYAMGPVANTVGAWLDRWSESAPDRVFLAERSGEGWRKETYSAVAQQVNAIATSLLQRGLNKDTPIMMLSGNSVDHGLLALAAQYVGVPIVPVAEQYSLVPEAHDRLRYVLGLIKPELIYVSDSTKYAAALQLEEISGIEVVASSTDRADITPLSTLLDNTDSELVAAAHASVTPESVAKILLTSGSTSLPKGVLTTHLMMCSNQTQIIDYLPFLNERPPTIVDWLPWNHVFGGSHNFNMMLANGGSLYIDEGKPAPGLFDRSLENLLMVDSNLIFNVPLGYSLLLQALQNNASHRDRFFSDLDMIFYAGASLPQDIWSGLVDMSIKVQGKAPLVTSSWGLTETAPAALLQHEPADRSGTVGVPMTGTTTKLCPIGDGRYEIRLKGPNITPGYLSAPEKTAESFDSEGYFITGDAMTFADPEHPEKGLRFDGRLGEDFKLLSGTWVQSANLRLEILPYLTPLATDVVITGADRKDIGVLIFTTPPKLADAAGECQELEGAVINDTLKQEVQSRLQRFSSSTSGSSKRIVRAMVLSSVPSVAAGEITAKGNLNSRQVLKHRSSILERLYSDDDPALVTL
ncbi:MAG: feruloyl-CoA synthase [Granulosicoccus sp.]|nr:feruloyl-CoA synthase [Granulosicoccus sp.]